MPCEKCGILLHESNVNPWLTEGIVLCINCEHELKALRQVIGNIRYFYHIIGRAYREKLANAIDGIYNHFEERGFGGIN